MNVALVCCFVIIVVTMPGKNSFDAEQSETVDVQETNLLPSKPFPNGADLDLTLRISARLFRA